MDWFNKSIKLTKGILSQNNGGVATSTNTDIVTDTVTDTDTNAATSIDPDTNEHTHTSRSVGTAHGTASGALWSSDSRRTDKGTKSATKSVTETKTKTETGIGTHPLPPALQCIYDRAVEAMAKDLVGKHNHGGMKDESLHDSSETSDTDVGLSNSAAGRSSTYSGRSDSHAGEVVTNGGKPAECTTAALESSRTFDCFSGEFLSYAAQHSTVHAEADVGVLEGVRDELHVYVLQLPASRSRDGRGEAEEPPGIETGRGRGQLRRNETLEGLAYICGLLKCLLVMSECGINQRRIASSQTGKTVLTLLQWAVAQVTQSGQSLVPDVPGQTVARSTNSSRVHTDPQDTIRPANGGVETGSDTDRRDSASAAEGQHVGLAVGEMALLNEIVVVSMRLWQRLCGVSDRTRTRAHAEKGVRVPQQGRQNTWDANTGTESGTGGQGAEPSDAPAAEDEQVWLDGWSERTFGVGVFGCKASNPLGLVGRMCGSDSAQTGTQAYTQIRRHTHSPVRAPGSSQIHAQPQPKGSDMSVVFDTGPVQPTQSMPYPAEVGDTAAQGCDEMSGHGTARRCEDELIHGTCERVSCTEAQGIRYNHAQVMDMLVACVELWEGLASVHAAHGCIGTHADVHGDTQTASRTHTHTAAEVLCGTSPPPPVDVHEDVRDTAGTSQTHTTHTPQLGSARTASVGPSRTHITQTEKLVYTPHVAVGTRQLWRESLFTAECMGRASYYDVATECVVTMATCLANGEQEQRDVFAVRGGWQKLIQTIGPRGHTRGLIPTREQAQSRVQTRARSCMDIAEGTRVSLEVSLQLLVVRFVVVFACEAEYVVGQRVVTNQMAAMEQCGAPGTNDIPLKDGGGVGDESYLNEALSSHLTRLLLWVSYQDHTLANTDARLHAGANDGPACGEYRANPPTSNTNSNGLLAFGRSGTASVMAPDVRYYREQPSRSLNRFTSTTDSTPSREILLGDSMVAINRTYDQIPTTTNTPTQSKTRASPNQQNSSGGGLAHSKTGSQENLTHPNPNSESDLIGSHAQRRASALSWQRMSLVRRRSNSIGGKRVLRDMAPLLLDLCMPPVLRASVFDHVVCEGRACVCDRVEEGEPATQVTGVQRGYDLEAVFMTLESMLHYFETGANKHLLHHFTSTMGHGTPAQCWEGMHPDQEKKDSVHETGQKCNKAWLLGKYRLVVSCVVNAYQNDAQHTREDTVADHGTQSTAQNGTPDASGCHGNSDDTDSGCDDESYQGVDQTDRGSLKRTSIHTGETMLPPKSLPIPASKPTHIPTHTHTHPPQSPSVQEMCSLLIEHGGRAQYFTLELVARTIYRVAMTTTATLFGTGTVPSHEHASMSMNTDQAHITALSSYVGYDLGNNRDSSLDGEISEMNGMDFEVYQYTQRTRLALLQHALVDETFYETILTNPFFRAECFLDKPEGCLMSCSALELMKYATSVKSGLGSVEPLMQCRVLLNALKDSFAKGYTLAATAVADRLVGILRHNLRNGQAALTRLCYLDTFSSILQKDMRENQDKGMMSDLSVTLQTVLQLMTYDYNKGVVDILQSKPTMDVLFRQLGGTSDYGTWRWALTRLEGLLSDCRLLDNTTTVAGLVQRLLSYFISDEETKERTQYSSVSLHKALCDSLGRLATGKSSGHILPQLHRAHALQCMTDSLTLIAHGTATRASQGLSAKARKQSKLFRPILELAQNVVTTTATLMGAYQKTQGLKIGSGSGPESAVNQSDDSDQLDYLDIDCTLLWNSLATSLVRDAGISVSTVFDWLYHILVEEDSTSEWGTLLLVRLLLYTRCGRRCHITGEINDTHTINDTIYDNVNDTGGNGKSGSINDTPTINNTINEAVNETWTDTITGINTQSGNERQTINDTAVINEIETVYTTTTSCDNQTTDNSTIQIDLAKKTDRQPISDTESIIDTPAINDTAHRTIPAQTVVSVMQRLRQRLTLGYTGATKAAVACTRTLLLALPLTWGGCGCTRVCEGVGVGVGRSVYGPCTHTQSSNTHSYTGTYTQTYTGTYTRRERGAITQCVCELVRVLGTAHMAVEDMRVMLVLLENGASILNRQVEDRANGARVQSGDIEGRAECKEGLSLVHEWYWPLLSVLSDINSNPTFGNHGNGGSVGPSSYFVLSQSGQGIAVRHAKMGAASRMERDRDSNTAARASGTHPCPNDLKTQKGEKRTPVQYGENRTGPQGTECDRGVTVSGWIRIEYLQEANELRNATDMSGGDNRNATDMSHTNTGIATDTDKSNVKPGVRMEPSGISCSSTNQVQTGLCLFVVQGCYKNENDPKAGTSDQKTKNFDPKFGFGSRVGSNPDAIKAGAGGITNTKRSRATKRTGFSLSHFTDKKDRTLSSEDSTQQQADRYRHEAEYPPDCDRKEVVCVVRPKSKNRTQGCVLSMQTSVIGKGIPTTGSAHTAQNNQDSVDVTDFTDYTLPYNHWVFVSVTMQPATAQSGVSRMLYHKKPEANLFIDGVLRQTIQLPHDTRANKLHNMRVTHLMHLRPIMRSLVATANQSAQERHYKYKRNLIGRDVDVDAGGVDCREVIVCVPEWGVNGLGGVLGASTTTAMAGSVYSSTFVYDKGDAKDAFAYSTTMESRPQPNTPTPKGGWKVPSFALVYSPVATELGVCYNMAHDVFSASAKLDVTALFAYMPCATLSGQVTIAEQVGDALRALGGLQTLVAVFPTSLTQIVDATNSAAEWTGHATGHGRATQVVDTLTAALNSTPHVTFEGVDGQAFNRVIACVGKRLANYSADCFDDNTPSAVERLVQTVLEIELPQRPAMVAAIQSHLLFNMRIWTRATVAVQVTALLAMKRTVQANPSQTKTDHGIKYFMLVMSSCYHERKDSAADNEVSSNVSPGVPTVPFASGGVSISDTDRRLLRRVIWTIIGVNIHDNSFSPEDATLVAIYLMGCKDEMQRADTLDFIFSLEGPALSRFLAGLLRINSATPDDLPLVWLYGLLRSTSAEIRLKATRVIMKLLSTPGLDFRTRSALNLSANGIGTSGLALILSVYTIDSELIQTFMGTSEDNEHGEGESRGHIIKLLLEIANVQLRMVVPHSMRRTSVQLSAVFGPILLLLKKPSRALMLYESEGWATALLNLIVVQDRVCDEEEDLEGAASAYSLDNEELQTTAHDTNTDELERGNDTNSQSFRSRLKPTADIPTNQPMVSADSDSLHSLDCDTSLQTTRTDSLTAGGYTPQDSTMTSLALDLVVEVLYVSMQYKADAWVSLQTILLSIDTTAAMSVHARRRLKKKLLCALLVRLYDGLKNGVVYMNGELMNSLVMILFSAEIIMFYDTHLGRSEVHQIFVNTDGYWQDIDLGLLVIQLMDHLDLIYCTSYTVPLQRAGKRGKAFAPGLALKGGPRRLAVRLLVTMMRAYQPEVCAMAVRVVYKIVLEGAPGSRNATDRSRNATDRSRNATDLFTDFMKGLEMDEEDASSATRNRMDTPDGQLLLFLFGNVEKSLQTFLNRRRHVPEFANHQIILPLLRSLAERWLLLCSEDDVTLVCCLSAIAHDTATNDDVIKETQSIRCQLLLREYLSDVVQKESAFDEAMATTVVQDYYDVTMETISRDARHLRDQQLDSQQNFSDNVLDVHIDLTERWQHLRDRDYVVNLNIQTELTNENKSVDASTHLILKKGALLHHCVNKKGSQMHSNLCGLTSEVDTFVSSSGIRPRMIYRPSVNNQESSEPTTQHQTSKCTTEIPETDGTVFVCCCTFYNTSSVMGSVEVINGCLRFWASPEALTNAITVKGLILVGFHAQIGDITHITNIELGDKSSTIEIFVDCKQMRWRPSAADVNNCDVGTYIPRSTMRRSFVLQFRSVANRDEFLQALADINASLAHATNNDRQRAMMIVWTNQWVARKLSNLAYLMRLNSVCERTLHVPQFHPIVPLLDSPPRDGSSCHSSDAAPVCECVCGCDAAEAGVCKDTQACGSLSDTHTHRDVPVLVGAHVHVASEALIATQARACTQHEYLARESVSQYLPAWVDRHFGRNHGNVVAYPHPKRMSVASIGGWDSRGPSSLDIASVAIYTQRNDNGAREPGNGIERIWYRSRDKSGKNANEASSGVVVTLSVDGRIGHHTLPTNGSQTKNRTEARDRIPLVDGRAIKAFVCPSSPVGNSNCSELSPNGNALFVARVYSGSLAVHDVETCAQTQVYHFHTGAITCMSTDCDSSVLITGGADCTVVLWAVEGSKKPAAEVGPITDTYESQQKGPTTLSGMTKSMGGEALKAKLNGLMSAHDYHLHPRQLHCGHTDQVVQVAVSGAMDLVVSASASGIVLVHSLRSNEIRARVNVANAVHNSSKFTGSDFGSEPLRYRSTGTSQVTAILLDDHNYITVIKVDTRLHDGKTLTHLVSMATNGAILSIRQTLDPVVAACYIAHGLMAVGGASGVLSFYQIMRLQREPKSFRFPEGILSLARMGLDCLLIGCVDGTLYAATPTYSDSEN